MERLIVLGTGAASAVRRYNTCSVLEGPEGRLLIDGGGGNGILPRLEDAGVKLEELRSVFVTHEHIDHLLGVLWVIRISATRWLAGRRAEPLTVYCHANLARKIAEICRLTLSAKQQAAIGEGVLLKPVAAGETYSIEGHRVTFFDIESKKAEQYGFRMEAPDGQVIVFCGDEPFRGKDVSILRRADWLLHEAFCVERDAAVFNPHAIGHSTAAEAAAFAAEAGAHNLVLWHTEEKTGDARRALYKEEASSFFAGCVHVPEDMEVIALKQA